MDSVHLLPLSPLAGKRVMGSGGGALGGRFAHKGEGEGKAKANVNVNVLGLWDTLVGPLR